VDVLTGAYRTYRQRMHHLSLEAASNVVRAAEFAEVRAAVTAIWDRDHGRKVGDMPVFAVAKNRHVPIFMP